MSSPQSHELGAGLHWPEIDTVCSTDDELGTSAVGSPRPTKSYSHKAGCWLDLNLLA